MEIGSRKSWILDSQIKVCISILYYVGLNMSKNWPSLTKELFNQVS